MPNGTAIMEWPIYTHTSENRQTNTHTHTHTLTNTPTHQLGGDGGTPSMPAMLHRLQNLATGS